MTRQPDTRSTVAGSRRNGLSVKVRVTRAHVRAPQRRSPVVVVASALSSRTSSKCNPVVVRPEWHGSSRNWILEAFDSRVSDTVVRGGDWDARETCGFAATCPFVRGKLVNGMYGFSAAAAHMHDETGTGRSDGGEGEYPREGSCIINITCAPIIRTPLRRRRRKSYRDEGKRKKGKKKSEKKHSMECTHEK